MSVMIKKLEAAKKEMAKAWWYYMNGVHEMAKTLNREPTEQEINDAWNEHMEAQKAASNAEKLIKKVNAARLRLAKALWWFKDGLHGDYCKFEGATDEELHSEAKAELFYARRALQELLETEEQEEEQELLQPLIHSELPAVKPIDISNLGPAEKPAALEDDTEKGLDCDYCGASAKTIWERPCGNSCYTCGKNHDFNTCKDCKDDAESSPASDQESCASDEEGCCATGACCATDAYCATDACCAADACCARDACCATDAVSAEAPVNRHISVRDMGDDEYEMPAPEDAIFMRQFEEEAAEHDAELQEARNQLDAAVKRAEAHCRELTSEVKYKISSSSIW